MRDVNIQSAYIQFNAILPAYSVSSVLSANGIFSPVITTGSAAVRASSLDALAPVYCTCLRKAWLILEKMDAFISATTVVSHWNFMQCTFLLVVVFTPSTHDALTHIH